MTSNWADPERTLAEVASAELSLTTVLCTHKHWDHAQGNEALAAHIPGLRVIGPAAEECPAVTETVGGGELIELFSSPWQARISVLFLCVVLCCFMVLFYAAGRGCAGLSEGLVHAVVQKRLSGPAF